MKLNKGAKVLVGLTTAWVVLYPLLFLALWFVSFGNMMLFNPRDVSGQMPIAFSLFGAIFPVHCLTIALQMGLSAFYLIHVIRNAAASETIRVILGIGVFFMPYIAMPVYYYLYIWKSEPPAWARQPMPGSS